MCWRIREQRDLPAYPVLREFRPVCRWDGSALQKILNTDIYQFRYKEQDADRIGLVIGEGYNTPQEVIQNDGVDQYAMGTMAFKAIQEMYTELKEEIAQLKAQIGG